MERSPKDGDDYGIWDIAEADACNFIVRPGMLTKHQRPYESDTTVPVT
jgi:hypothetical protein